MRADSGCFGQELLGFLEVDQGLAAGTRIGKRPRERGETMEKNPSGKPQGRVVSPLLADLYLDGLNKAVNERNQMKAVMVRFADDLVVLCRKGQGWVVAENHPRLPTLLERRNSQHSRAETITNPF